MAKPNYQFEKRQRELAKKKKKEEKLQQRRSGASGAPEGELPDGASPDASADDATEPSQDNAAPPAASENSA